MENTKEKDLFLEMFLGTPGVKARLQMTPIVTKRKFFEMAKPCDIFVTRTPAIQITTKKARIISSTLRFAQGSPFTSSKILLPNMSLIGYGVNYAQDSTYLSEMPLKNYLKLCDFACMVRVPDLTEIQKQKIYKYMLSRKRVPYDSIGLLKTAWNKIMPDFLHADFKLDEPEDKRIIRGYRKALFCSTIISMAFLYAGVQILKKPLEVWPRNFLLSPKAILVARISG